jgi:hypothetical protein
MTWRALTAIGTVLATGLTAHTFWNTRHLRTPRPPATPVRETVSVLLPVRDEEHQVSQCVRALRSQQLLDDVEVLVLDDGSTDRTAERVEHAGGGDVRLLAGEPRPPGWLGKPWACAQLARHARGSVLCFVDADVRLQPEAVAAAVALLREDSLDLVSPYPRQLADGWGPRLVQPLLQWSWLTTLPLRRAEHSQRASLAAANGQFLVVDAATYRRAGGHHGVRAEVLDDVALLRAVKRVGGRGGMADGTKLATCRMYEDWAQLRMGYEKSLWSAFGTPMGAAVAMTALNTAYVVPFAAAAGGNPVGAVGYLAAVAGRLFVARRTGQRTLPDALAHPLSILALTWLTWQSWRGRAAGTLQWKGRPVAVGR